MSANLLEGARLFNDGEFWHAHEAFEQEWIRREKGTDARRFYQGLILICAALIHHKRGAASAIRCYRSALRKLDGLPGIFDGVRLGDLIRDAGTCIERDGPAPSLHLVATGAGGFGPINERGD